MEENGKAVPALPAAQDNAGNLFKQLGSNIYTESLEQLKREGKVSVKTRIWSGSLASVLLADICATYSGC
jgi:hypothetical protein